MRLSLPTEPELGAYGEADILRSIADGVLVLDMQGVVLDANHMMGSMLGAEPTALVGKELTAILSETELLGLLGLDGAVPSEGPAWLQVVFRSLQGAYIPLSVTLSMLKSAAEQDLGYVMVCRDQTEIRELLTDSARIAAEEVERRVQLQREKDDAERRERMQMEVGQAQKLESIGQLAAGIAHEINTPIQFIGDNVTFLRRAFGMLLKVVEHAQRLSRASAEELPDLVAGLKPVIRKAKLDYVSAEVPKALSQTQDGVERVAHIVKAMKEVSHPSSGQLQDVDLHRIIESSVTVARNEWKYVAELDFDLQPDAPMVPCYSDEVSQVVLNIVVNAAHAIGDVVGDSKGDLGRIGISTSYDDQWATIRISDTGTGMPKHVVERIFDPFYTTKEVGKGTGQGLALSYHVVVTKHRGTIDVETEEGKGTTFVIKLPMAPPDSAGRATDPGTEAP